MKNLLELCLSPDLGGLELYMMRAAKALSEEMDVISVISPKGKLESYYKETPHRYEMVEKGSNLLMFGAAKKLAKIIDDHSIDVVHLHWTKDIPIAVLAKKLSKQKPKLVQTRNMNMTRFKDDFYHRFLYQNIDMMLPVTQRVAEQIKKFVPDAIRPRVELLYMGTDIIDGMSEKERGTFRVEQKMEQTFAVGMVGRIEEHKGQHLLIEAIVALENVSAFFVGHEMVEGYTETLKEQAKHLGVEERVHFLGFMKNPMHFMQACDAMVLATPCETFGLVVIEAMSVGTPMIATKACGPLEIIEDGVSGMLFEDQDINALRQKIELLSSNSELHRALSAEAVTVVHQRFNTQVQFEKLRELIGSMF